MDKKLKDENKEMINRINKEKNEEIQKIYKNIKQNIDIAIKNLRYFILITYLLRQNQKIKSSFAKI